MAPRKMTDVLVMVANIGLSSSMVLSPDGEPFIEKVKHAMRIVVEKKIFVQPKDEIAIITMGDKTNNPEGLDHINLYCDNLLVPSWDMVKYIESLESTKNPSNWIEALHVSLCFIEKEIIDPRSRVILVIFNNFKESEDAVNQYGSNFIIEQLKTYENLRLLFVGDNETCNDSPSEKFALSIIEENLAQYEQISNFIAMRQFYTARQQFPTPWRVDLEWDGLCIPCSTYVKTRSGSYVGPWKMQRSNESREAVSREASSIIASNSNSAPSVAGNTIANSTNNTPSVTSNVIANNSNGAPTVISNVVKKSVQLDVHRNEVPPENIINGYKFGGKYVPFSEEDEAAMKFGNTQKSLKIYGFVPQSEVKLEYWAGFGSRIVVPQSEVHSKAFYSLVKAMVDLEYAAVVRKVYQNNNLPKMGVLFPKTDNDEVWCLAHLEIPFSEEIRVIKKRTIKIQKNDAEQDKLASLDSYIDAMTIHDDEPSYLNLGNFPNVKKQYHWNALANRALNPNGPLIEVSDYLKKYLSPPENLTIKAKPHVEKLDLVFVRPKTEIVVQEDKADTPVTDVPKQDSNENGNDSQTNAPMAIDGGFFSPEDFSVKMEDFDDM
ncbi:hypothetical protein QAD02_019121 [Eretmocerus hayati]|uniref:Uncharacterized protein n=1 Tax=Eretmocerus hayati TaxID=131215 RepID=A0ACC2PL61_9HYME|nr:hypothetical protein QAD02_019121 [Eretmocerus hayati]